jgi:hypothetical protein
MFFSSELGRASSRAIRVFYQFTSYFRRMDSVALSSIVQRKIGNKIDYTPPVVCPVLRPGGTQLKAA